MGLFNWGRYVGDDHCGLFTLFVSGLVLDIRQKVTYLPNMKTFESDKF